MKTTLPTKRPKDFNHWVRFNTIVNKVKFNIEPTKVKDNSIIQLRSK